MKPRQRFGNDMTFGRFFAALLRRAQNIPDYLSWNLNIGNASYFKDKIYHFKDIHAGERCFILGNGPSLSRMNLDLLESEYSFGLNRIYLLFENFRFRPTYYVAVNALVLDQFSTEITALHLPKFINWNQRSKFPQSDNYLNYINLKLSINDSFQKDMVKPISSGGTVTFVAMQLAYWMGFTEVILIGVDHNFVSKGVPNKTEVQEGEVDKNHFHPNYFPKGVKWQLPDLLRSEIAYRMAREEFEKDGRRIVDATVGGHLNVFPKVDYYKIVKR